MNDFRVRYMDAGIEKSTGNVWVEWDNGYCYLVRNEFGVIGAVITMNDGDKGWHEAYDAAIDEIAHDIDPDLYTDEEFQMALEDGIATYRGSGEPSNPKLKSHIADTQYLSVERAVSFTKENRNA